MACVPCVSTTFFQPAWSGSHLYSAHRGTVRSGLGESVLLALVGFPVWDCRSLAFCTFSIPYFRRFVKRFFRIFSSASTITTVGELSAEPPGRLHSPPDINYYSRFYADYNRQNAQITGILRPHLCALYILTKLLAAWYNGNSAQDARRRAANYSTFSAFCQEFFKNLCKKEKNPRDFRGFLCISLKISASASAQA